MKTLTAALLLLALLAGCAPSENTEQSDAASSPAAEMQTQSDKSEHAGHGETKTDEHAAHGGDHAGHKIFFVTPQDGAKVKSPLKIQMGLEGMDVKPAGELVENSGHHHLIIDGAPIEAGVVVPADDKHIHFGQGQTETEVELSPGEHTLTLQFADGHHKSYGPEMSTTIRVTVE